jgi:hypothetical protein
MGRQNCGKNGHQTSACNRRQLQNSERREHRTKVEIQVYPHFAITTDPLTGTPGPASEVSTTIRSMNNASQSTPLSMAVPVSTPSYLKRSESCSSFT